MCTNMADINSVTSRENDPYEAITLTTSDSNVDQTKISETEWEVLSHLARREKKTIHQRKARTSMTFIYTIKK